MKCKKCKAEMEFQDDSFSHDWAGGGVEVIKYWICPECGHDEDYD